MPLPDPDDKSTYVTIPVNAEVLALWPDSTTLYKAKISSLPGRVRNRLDHYRVIYEDDNNEKKSAPINYVIDRP